MSAAEVATELKRHAQHTAGQESGHVGRVIPIIEALLLSVVTVVTAWAGYSAAKWSTDSRLELAHASSLRLQANRALATAMETRNFDSSTFEAWFTAFTLDNPQKMQIAEHRFRPAFLVAFQAWRATRPETNLDAPPGPTYMPQYKQPEQAKAVRLDRRAETVSRDGEHSGSVADNYVRITVLLAAVLFLIGIGTTFKLRQVRYGLASVGGLLMVAAVVLIAQQPRPR
ncbi:MAG: hypothetical protein ACXV2J_00845 [Actinomycetes bacterium]